LVDDNYELIEEAKYFEHLNVDGNYHCIGIQLTHFSLFSFPFNNKWILCPLFLFIVSNIFRFMQDIFSHEGLEGVDLQNLNIVWQTSGFVYRIIVWGLGCWWSKELVLQWAKLFWELKFNSPQVITILEMCF
jgi:hypothetical protein